MPKKAIFISHSTKDKEVADMLVDFLHNVGIDKELIFCSSLPGNGVIEKIPDEVRFHLKESEVNIAILSNNYYQSVYCLNEAGIIWYDNNKKAILIALPEININNLVGFLDKNYLLHDLNSEKDILSIYDIVMDELKYSNTVKVTTINNEKIKLKARYDDYLKNREVANSDEVSNSCEFANKNATNNDLEIVNFSTDDEKALIYYICKKNKRKISKNEFKQWLQDNEIYSIDVNNSFDLLNVKKFANISNGTLSIDIERFEKLINDSNNLLANYEEIVMKHTNKSVDVFKKLWSSGYFNKVQKIFCAYIVDEKISKFDYDINSENQIKDIYEWENKKDLIHVLSKNYSSCLRCFISNNFVYKSNKHYYTGQYTEYSLYESIKNYLHGNPKELQKELSEIKDSYYTDLPFD